MIVLSHKEDGSISERKLTEDDLNKLSEVYNEVNARDTSKIKAILAEKSFHI